MKTILVTGGNRGIGLEICRQLAESGHRVILCSRDLGRGLEAAKKITGNIVVRQLDVTDESSIRSLRDSIESDFGKLDVLVNNAGIGDVAQNAGGISRLQNRLRKDFRGIWKMVKLVKPLLKLTGLGSQHKTTVDTDLANAKNIMETNFYGPWRMIQVFASLLFKSDDARIINISSRMGELDRLNGDYPGYRMSKSSLNALTIMFSKEFAKKGVRVNAMCPGWVRTDMGGLDAPRSVSQGADTAVWLATMDQIPTGKFFQDRKEINW